MLERYGIKIASPDVESSRRNMVQWQHKLLFHSREQ